MTDDLRCHPREGGGPASSIPGRKGRWLPAFAGMTMLGRVRHSQMSSLPLIHRS